MVVLLNMLLPVIIGGILLTAYKTRKVWVAALVIPTIILYGMLQPSYLPKGTVKPSAPIAAFEVIDGPMVDRVAKPMSGADRDARLQDKYNDAEQRRQNFLKEEK